MELAMVNGFGGAGFTELDEQEMMWVDGGDIFSSLMHACKFLFVGAVSSIGAVVGGTIGTAITGHVGVGTAIGGLVGGYLGSLAGEYLWSQMFE